MLTVLMLNRVLRKTAKVKQSNLGNIQIIYYQTSVKETENNALIAT